MATATLTEPRLGTRWPAALLGGLVALAIALAICAGLIAWAHPTFPDSGDGARARFQEVLPVVQGAPAAVLGFQRVPVIVDRQESEVGRGAEHLTYRVVASPLGGLLLVGFAIALGGITAQRIGGRARNALATGLRMALVFAAACFALSFLVPLAESFTDSGVYTANPYTIAYRPSHFGSVVWPLVWGFLFGSLGALIGRHGRGWRRELLATIDDYTSLGGTAVRAAGSGLVTGVSLVLLAGVLTAAVGIAFHTTEAGEVLGSPRNIIGISEGIVIGLPHATGAALLASMGTPADYTIRDPSVRGGLFMRAGIFGGHGQEPLFQPRTRGDDIAVPRYALGGLLIALVLTMVTGYRAAARAAYPREIAKTVIAAAACLTIFLWIVAYLVSVEVEIIVRLRSDISGGTARIGPSFLWTLILPPLWALGGGFLGAALFVRRGRSGARSAESSEFGVPVS